MSENSPSTKKLKSMLKMLSEHNVAKYKDSEIEIQFAPNMDFLKAAEEEPKEFNFSNYDAAQQKKISDESKDDLGFTEEDYLYWSANNS